jgi:hypothetical protein
MDIEAFYAQNEARRSSAEVEFGTEWTDSTGNEYALSWIEGTGELYLMLGPEATVTTELFFGDVMNYNEPVEGLLVQVIGEIRTIEEVEQVLEGWPSAMLAAGSLSWLAAKFPSASM